MKKLQDRKKILMLVDAWFPHIGGGQVHVWELSKALTDLGYDLEIFTRNNGDWDEKYRNLKVIRKGFIKSFNNPVGRIEYLIRALIYSLFADYDILHAHAFSPGLLIPFVKFFRNKKTVFTVHGSGYKIAGFGFGSNFLENLVFYRIPYDLEVTVAKKTLTKSVKAKRLKVIPNGVNVNLFKKAQRKRAEIKKLCYMGRLFYDKGVDLLIEAVKGLSQSLTIIGEGPEIDILKKMSRGIRVKFLGAKTGNDLIAELKKVDLLILPSRHEGQPIRLLEAWASKLPVLVTDVGDNREFIKNGVNGFITKDNVINLSKAIKRIIKNRNLVKITENGYISVNNYTWEKIAKVYDREYERLIND